MIRLYFLFYVILIKHSISQDIRFPSESTTPIPRSIDIGSGGKCPTNMTLVFVNGTSDCECISEYVYHLESDSCFKPFLRGPCDEGYHLIIPESKMISECANNPCEEGYVVYNGTCTDLLNSSPPCSKGYRLVYNETTFKMECDYQGIAVTYQFITAPIKPCAGGSRRVARGKCRPIL